MHDIVGHYNRFDIFELKVNTAPQRPITLYGAAPAGGEAGRVHADEADGTAADLQQGERHA